MFHIDPETRPAQPNDCYRYRYRYQTSFTSVDTPSHQRNQHHPNPAAVSPSHLSTDRYQLPYIPLVDDESDPVVCCSVLCGIHVDEEEKLVMAHVSDRPNCVSLYCVEFISTRRKNVDGTAFEDSNNTIIFIAISSSSSKKR